MASPDLPNAAPPAPLPPLPTAPAQRAQARDPLLQYLAAVMCVRLSLWGKAQHLLRQCIATSADPEIKGDAQRMLESLTQRKD